MLSGRRLDLLDPVPADIAIEDIAHGLARVARWNGQTLGAQVFSVAQHSLLVEDLAESLAPGLDGSARLQLLLHDAPEYVVGDLISPFKAVVGDGYRIVEQRLMRAIRIRFGLGEPDAQLFALVKTADRVAAFLEAVTLAGFSEAEAEQLFGGDPCAVSEEARRLLVPMATGEAEAAFLNRFAVLAEGRPR